MKKYVKSILCVILAVCMVIPMFAACTGNNPSTTDTSSETGAEMVSGEAGTGGSNDPSDNNNNNNNNNNPPTVSGISNETTPLVIASEALDGVFNPFYYTNGADGDVVGLTQLGMLTTDANGNLVCGYDEDSVALAYSIVTTGTQADYDASNSYKDYYTDYYFAIKNGIKFSNGEALTINDVLFNIYVLVDPAYTGSSTLYSVDIQGLKAYRSQSRDEAEQDQMDEYFDSLAADRITEVTLWCEDESSTKDQITATMQEVITKAEGLFREELQSDWSSASSSIESYEKYGFTEAWEVFLYMEGLVTVKSRRIKQLALLLTRLITTATTRWITLAIIWSILFIPPTLVHPHSLLTSPT